MKREEQLTDKAFSRMMITSILAILVCIISLCSSSYAWFTTSLPTVNNEIKSADECLLEIKVEHNGEMLSDIENGVELVANEVYNVTLSLEPNSASGYCKILAGNQVYYSEYIVRHGEPTPQTLSFTLSVETTQVVTFTKHWGIFSQQSDIVNDILIIP